MLPLAEQVCVPCRGDSPPLSKTEIQELSPLVPGWQIVQHEGLARLEQTFTFKNFAQALAFTNQIGALAEAADHHPAILIEWGQITVTWWTHAINNLHRNDFIMAAKVNQLIKKRDKNALDS